MAELREGVPDFTHQAVEARAGCSIPTVELDQMLQGFTPQAVAGAVVLPTGLGLDIWAELEVSRAEAAEAVGVAAVLVEPEEWVERVK